MTMHITLTSITAFALLVGIVVAWLLRKRHHVFEKISLALTQRRAVASLILFMALYAFIFSWISIHWYDNYATNIYDLGNMNQAMWNTLHGEPLRMTTFFPATNRLFMHVEPIFFLLAPLYAVWQDPRMLLILQTVILALGAIPVFALARHLSRDRLIALLFAFIYLLNPLLHQGNLSEFHPLVLGVPFLLAAYYFFVVRRLSLSFIFFLLALSAREDIALVVILTSMLMFWMDKQRKFAIAIGTTALLWAAFIFLVVYPATAISDAPLQYRHYSALGDSVSDIALNILKNPSLILNRLFDFSTPSYFFFLSAMTGFLAVFSKKYLLIGLSSFAVIFLHSFWSEIMLGLGQYHAPLVFPLMLAALFGFIAVQKKFSLSPGEVIALILFPLVIANIFLIPRTAYVLMLTDNFRNTYSADEVAAADEARKLIPDEASVVASWKLGSKVSGRRNLFLMPTRLRFSADFVFVRSTPEEKCDRPELAREETTGLIECEGTFEQYQRYLNDVAMTHDNIFNKQGVLLYKKK